MEVPLSPLQGLGFLLAAWAVIGNDSLQTLGPFLQANRGRVSRALQALYLSALLCAVLLLGWWLSGGDASWGRLASYPPPARFGPVDLLPPLAVLLLTQAGVPVSTSFLVLTALVPANLPALLRRSLLGYGLALAVGLLAYGAVLFWRRWVGPLLGAGAQAVWGPAAGGGEREGPPGGSPCGAVSPVLLAGATGAALALQWLTTGWLWSQWLIQDLANIFIYLPRQLSAALLALSLGLLCAAVIVLLAQGGGAIQEILRRKSGLEDPGASTALSLLYGAVLAALSLGGQQPLSTTWVFLGLLAGRELALQLAPQPRPMPALLLDLGRDLVLAALGLAVSLAVALLVQPLRP